MTEYLEVDPLTKILSIISLAEILIEMLSFVG